MAFIHPVAEDFSAVAKATLEAAAELGLPATVVKSSSDGRWGMGLIVPDKVAEAFHKYMESSQYPIRVDMDELLVPVVELELEAEEPEPEPEPDDEAEDKPKRGPGRPRKAAAKAKTETEE